MPGPLAVAGITALGTGLLNYLAGRGEAGRREVLRRQLLALFSPESIGREANVFFDQLRRSPLYSGLRTRAMLGSTSLANRLQASFAERGLGTSGIAGLALPIARSSFQQGFQDIDMDLFTKALAQARELLSLKASALTGTAGPSGLQLGIGNTLQAMMPFLLKYFENQLPRGGGKSFTSTPDATSTQPTGTRFY